MTIGKDKIDLADIRQIYIIGIEGAGTSALAKVLKGMGKAVVGSDEGDHFYQDVLRKEAIRTFFSFDEKNIAAAFGGGDLLPDLFIFSTAFKPETNPELKFALESGIPTIGYPEALGVVFNQKFGIAVSGTHGKTTTTAMIAQMMKEAGADPTAIVGSKVNQWGSGAIVGTSQYFVLEADEYQDKFQHYRPLGVVLTSADYDHPDFFPDFESYKQTFKDFIATIPPYGFLVVCGEDADTVEIAKVARCEVIFYGGFLQQWEEIRLKEEFEKMGKRIKIVRTPVDLTLTVPGAHNRLDATAALCVGRKLGLDEEKMKVALAGFQGTARRFETVGEHRSGALIIDDYAHHPAEVRATLKAVREKYPDRRIVCVFHPHTFTRTKALLEDFAQSFSDADKIIVLDIFGSAREKQGQVHSQDLVDKLKKYMKDAENIATIDEAHEFLEEALKENDLLITMGAGDVWNLGKKLMEKKSQRAISKC